MSRPDATSTIGKVLHLGTATTAIPQANNSATVGICLVGTKSDGTRMNKKFPNEAAMNIWLASDDAQGYEFSNAIPVTWP